MAQGSGTAMKNHKYIDIFAGCGGLSLGMYKSGWKSLFAIEKSPMAFRTLKHNLIDKKEHFVWPKWLPQKNHDINYVLKKYGRDLEKLRGKVSLVAGGPPCQGFSLAGRRNPNDMRNTLVKSYIDFVKTVRPKMLFFENVKGFTVGFKGEKSRGKPYSGYLTKRLEKEGYNVKTEIIDFSEFGVPQRRRRFILFGIKNGDAKEFFEELVGNRSKFLKRKGINARVTAKQAISDLERRNGEALSETFRNFKEGQYSKPKTSYQKLMRKESSLEKPDSHRFANHGEKTIAKFDYILKNCSRNRTISQRVKKIHSLKKKCIVPLDAGSSSPTLTTLPDDYIHYSEPRILTVREYARMQAFDDWFEFKDKYTTGGDRRKEEVPRYTQVGNAIPPLFAEQSGIALKRMIT